MKGKHLLVTPDMSAEGLDDPFIVIVLGKHGTCIDWYGVEDPPTGVICDDLRGAVACALEMSTEQRKPKRKPKP